MLTGKEPMTMWILAMNCNILSLERRINHE